MNHSATSVVNSINSSSSNFYNTEQRTAQFTNSSINNSPMGISIGLVIDQTLSKFFASDSSSSNATFVECRTDMIHIQTANSSLNNLSEIQAEDTYMNLTWSGSAGAEYGQLSMQQGFSKLLYTVGADTTYISMVGDLGDTLPGVVLWGVRSYADNTAALSAGLQLGSVYHTGGILKIVI
jgi:hypothetical protein